MEWHVEQRGWCLRLKNWSSLIFAGLLVAMAGCASESSSAPTTAGPPSGPPKVQFGSVVCLTTQWYPHVAQNEDETENRLVRELARQAVLIAARDELGLVTRDETLGEPFPKSIDAAGQDASSDNGNAQHDANESHEPLILNLEVDDDGTWDARLYGAGSVIENPVWRHEGKFDFDPRTIYAQLATQAAELCPIIAERLRAAGASGSAAKPNPDNVPPAEINDKLAAMNFVSQFAAVRAAHRAMAEKGRSAPWIGVLVRGYAHLAMLTEHSWASHHEAFAARSLLYAERMMQIDGGSQLAQWHRAYARALVGMHGSAIDQLEGVNAAPETIDNILPAWTSIITPYVRFNHDELETIAAEQQELAETAALLQWKLYHSYMHGRWIYEKGMAAMQSCPEAFSVYAVMANWPALMIQRLGVSRGMVVFGQQVPLRVAELEDLPAQAREAVDAQIGGADNDQRQQSLAMMERPMKISRALVQATAEEKTPSECSWAILASLIAEEQFIEAANLLTVSGNAVEHSKKELVEYLMPLVEGHRYAAYIRSFGKSPRESQQAAEILAEMTIVDPKASMWQLYLKMWQLHTADGRSGGDLAWRAIWSRNFTQAGLLEAWYGKAAEWFASKRPDFQQKMAGEFLKVSPSSPNALRLQWEMADAPAAAQLAKWETELADDPVGWMSLGSRYYRVGDLESAIRCYRRSIEINPCFPATKNLAACYYEQGKKDLWQSTLETYLEVEDLSLSHAQIHQMIANENIAQRKWKQAEPHALEAAGTYSAWGLQLASRVYEGLQDWEKSEYFSAEATRNYPSYSSGTDWYFWTRRTGRGDAESAREFAKDSIEIAAARTNHDDAYRTFVYYVLEGDAKKALAGLDQQVAMCPHSEGTWDKVWRLLHTIIVAGETKDSERKKQATEELRALAQQDVKNSDPDWVEVVEGLCKAFDGQQLDEEFLKKYDETISKADPSGRCNYEYFMGAALDQLGQTQQAELYWRRAAFGGPFATYNATLAGDRLVKRLGPDRGGMPEELLKQEAEAKPQEPKSEVEDDEVGESDPSI